MGLFLYIVCVYVEVVRSSQPLVLSKKLVGLFDLSYQNAIRYKRDFNIFLLAYARLQFFTIKL